MKSKQELRKIDGWFYVYLAELGADEPFTVILKKSPIYEGRYLLFSEKVLVLVHIVDLTNPVHPYIIGEVTGGDYNSLNLGVNWADDYSLQRTTGMRIPGITECRRYVLMWTAQVQSSIYRSVQRTNSIGGKDRLDGIESVLLRV